MYRGQQTTDAPPPKPMKSKSRTIVCSDNTCPHCKGQINYSSLYLYFQDLERHTDFEYQCPHCLKIINVAVEVVPAFTLSA